MKGFEKVLYQSKSNANQNVPSSGSVENNENDLIGDKLIPEFANHKISYGKKFISPRKKILTEIKANPSASDAEAHKNSNLDLEKSPLKKGVCNSSVKVYDPLTNYLSPRPRYLRFNPNRRCEIFKRLEKEMNSSLDSEEASDIEEIADSSLSPPKGSDNGNVVDGSEAEIEEIADSSRSPPKGNAVNHRNGGTSDGDNGNAVDCYEDEEEERGWCLRGISRLLFTLIACLLLTSYICPMNSPMHSPTQQAIWDLKDSGVVVNNQTLEFFSTNLHGNGVFEVEDGGNNSIEEVEVEGENYGETDESIEAEIVEYLEWHEKEMVEDGNVDSEDIVDEAAEFEGVRDARFEFEADKSQHLIDAKTDENLDGGILLDTDVVCLDEDNVNMDEAAETEIIGGVVDYEAQSSGNLIGPETVDSEDASACMLEMETHCSKPLQGPQFSSEPVFEEMPTEESKGENEAGSLEELVGSHEELSDSMDEVDDIEDDAEIGMETSEWNTVVGVSAALALLVVSTSLAIVYRWRKSRSSSTSSKETEPELLKQRLAAVEGNVNPVLPSIDRKVEFLARASLPSHAMREAPTELPSHIHAPTVELIGEIVVGQPSRVRNSGKFQMIVSEDECNAATLSRRRGERPQVVPALSQPSAVELRPSTSSTSCGSFTTERKNSKKEGGQSREAVIGTTPVRRSSRLRNRPAVMSP